MTFLDLAKAYDTISHEKMFEICLYYGLDPKFVSYIKKMYSKAVVQVEGCGGRTDPVQLLRGVVQGCPLSTTLFTLSFSPLLEALQKGPGISTQLNGNIAAAMYVDDTTIMASNIEEHRIQSN